VGAGERIRERRHAHRRADDSQHLDSHLLLCGGLALCRFGQLGAVCPERLGRHLRAAAIIFFAYIGFDAVSTAAEETRDPQRNMPIGMIASLVICTVIYIAVAIVLTGMVSWRQLGTAEPLATAFALLNINWARWIIALGAVCATTGVLLVFQLGQPRIFFSMARDGLLPQWAAKVHRSTRRRT